MDYFTPVCRKLARLRCVLDAITCLKIGKSLPDSLCYFPSTVEYSLDPEVLRSFSKAKDSSCLSCLDVFESPSLVSGKVFSIEFPKDPRPDWVRLRCEGQWQSQEDEIWLKVLELRIDGTIKLTNGFLRLKPIQLLLRPLSKTPTKTVYHGALGVDWTIARWINVVEIMYGTTATKSYLLSSKISPPVEAMVRRLKDPPDANWSLKHDVQLLKFVSLFNESQGASSHHLGTLSPYVEKLEVSSSTEGDGDDLAANEAVAATLTDSDPSTYWESDGSPETHYIRLYMKTGVIIDRLFISVDSQDDTYMPARVTVSLGDTLAELDQVNEVIVDRRMSGDICVLEGQAEYHKIVEIEIPECREDGIDVRIHGVKLKAKAQHLGMSDVQSGFLTNANRLASFPLLVPYDSDVLRHRFHALDRFLVLFDSVLSDVFPPATTDEGRLFEALEEIRCLMPFSRKATMLFETALKKTEAKIDDIPVPKLIIDRHAAAEVRDILAEGLPPAEVPSGKTVFVQVYRTMRAYNKDSANSDQLTYRFPRNWLQWWEFKFIGEGVIDQGGPFRDVLCDITDELCPLDQKSRPALPHFLRIDNQYDDEIGGSEGFVPNPSCREFRQFEFIGTLIGACIRSQEHLVLSLVPFIWKKILGETVLWEDYATVDNSCVKQLQTIVSMSEAEFDDYFGVNEEEENHFTCALVNGSEVPLCDGGAELAVTFKNRHDYVALVKKAKLGEFDEQIGAIRRGLLTVVPEAALRLITWQQLEEKVCGNPIVSVEELKKNVKYEGVEKEDKRVVMLFEALANFTNEERSKFLRFVTGRRRLPAFVSLCSEKSDNAKDTLPESSTCSNALYLPEYSSVKVLEEKLRYAIYNCIAIDTDTSPWD